MSDEIEFATDPAEFIGRCGEWLIAADDCYKSVLATANAARDGYDSFSDNVRFGIFVNHDAVNGCWIEIRDGEVRVPSLEPAQVEQLCRALQAQDRKVSAVYGPESTVTAFADAWYSISGIRLKPKTHWQVVTTESPTDQYDQDSGSLRLARRSHRELIRTWAEQYQDEKPAPISIADFLLGKQERQHLYIWEDPEPVSMLATTSIHDRQANITALYTPPHHRRKNHASKLVAATTRAMFDRGIKRCALLFDRTDPYLGDLYTALGYRYAERHAAFGL